MFLSHSQISDLAHGYGTPLYIYSKEVLVQQAQKMLAVPAPYGLTIRYAMKANPYPQVLETLRQQGIKIDASSGYEAAEAIEQGFQPSDISLTGQQLAHNLRELVEQGIEFNATSLRQLEEYGKLFPATEVGVRINHGIGSGHSAKTDVGGVASSFGIWHEYINQIHAICQKYQLTIKRMHTHIGSGADPAIWQKVIRLNLDLIKNFAEARTLNLGGGFKVARVPEEIGANMKIIGEALARELESFAKETGRKLYLELEPGSFLVVNSGMLVAQIDDIVDTGKEGYTFIKLNTGMNDILRPSLYGAQHPIEVINNATQKQEYIVVGHNCESGDLLTPTPGDGNALKPRTLNKAKVGDLVSIGGVGAYCASMAVHGYNSFPNAHEILV